MEAPAPETLSDIREQLDYWKSKAKSIERDLAAVAKSQTAVEVLCERARELAPKSYSVSPPQCAIRKPSHGSPQSAVLLFSDTHIGAEVKPEQTLGLGGYNFEIFLRRLWRLEQSVASILQDHTTTEVPEIVIPMLGDQIDGALEHSAECGQLNTLLAQFYSGGHAIAQFFRNMARLAPLRIYGTVGNHCVDGETEIFTDSGWKRGDAICPSDKCLGLSPETGKVFWQTQKFVQEKRVDRMVSISNRQFDFRGTEHHRFYFRPLGTTKIFEARWSEISVLTRQHGIEVPVSGEYDGSEDLVPDKFIELSAAVLTDGSIDKNGRVVIYQSKNSDWIRSALARAGLKFSCRTRSRPYPSAICSVKIKTTGMTTELSFGLSAPASREFLAATGLKKGRLPDWVWAMSTPQFERFLGALLAGDGTGTLDDPSPVLYGKSAEWLGQIQGLCAMHGWKGLLSSYCPKGNPKRQYRLSLCKTRFVTVGAAAQIEYSDGTDEAVWCVITPSENFLCRRKGVSYFTGNTRWQNQKRMPTKNRASNLDMFLYLYVEALLRDVPNIKFHFDWQPFACFEVQGFPFFCGHGDNLRGGDKILGIPNHAIGRSISTMTQLLTRAGKSTPAYYCYGHLHRPITLPHCKGEVLVNGSFVGIDGYALTEAFNSSQPLQRLFLMHPKFGRSASYDLRLDIGDGTPHKYSIPTVFECK